MSTRSLNWLKFGGLVALAFALGLLFAGFLNLPRFSAAQEVASAGRAAAIQVVPPPAIPSARSLTELSDAFAAVANAVVPSVVFIRAEHTERAPRRPQVQLPPGWDQFFNLPRNQAPRFEQGAGSGFIVSPNGYIVTNNHVIAGADRIIVRLKDRREFRATLVGTDPTTDVAVLKIDATGLTPASLGDSDNEQIGEWVLAIGNPLGDGLTFTVTSGIVSAKGRRLDGLQTANTSIGDFIQTDAAINPGNSGGPLVNVRGQVIGMNSAIASETGYFSGYAFAIPINLVRNVMDQLITSGKVQRAAMVVNIRDASEDDAEYVGLKDVRGVLVASIPSEDSPARKAGIEAGDVIISVDGKPVYSTGQLQQEIGFRKPGDVVRIEVARKGGVRKTFEVKLTSLDQTQVASRGDSTGGNTDTAASPRGTVQNLLGLNAQVMSNDAAQQYNLNRPLPGVMITDITPGGPAYEAGLQPASDRGADVIESVEGTPVRTAGELARALQKAGKGTIVSLGMTRVLSNGSRQNYVQRIRLGGDT